MFGNDRGGVRGLPLQDCPDRVIGEQEAYYPEWDLRYEG